MTKKEFLHLKKGEYIQSKVDQVCYSLERFDKNEDFGDGWYVKDVATKEEGLIFERHKKYYCKVSFFQVMLWLANKGK